MDAADSARSGRIEESIDLGGDRMKRKLLIACNNEEDAAGLANAFFNLEQIELIKPVFSGRQVVDAILTTQVDLLLMDLFLMDLDGLAVLDYLGQMNEDRRPLVFVMTVLPDDRLISSIKDKIVYCFIKPLRYETVQLRVLELMRTAELADARQNDQIDILESQIAASIRAIGVPAHLKGYYYLRDAIRIYAMSECPVDISITNDIYPTVAKLYNTRPPLVEHAMRTAIETAWTRGNLDTIHAYFGYTINDYKGKPSNLEFVAMMAERALTYVKKH